MLKWKMKKFTEFTTLEWYQIAKLRVDTFIVEQKCTYRDLDDYDQVSTHIFLQKNDQIVAYMRLIPSGNYYQEASLGRVIVKESERGFGYGRELLDKGVHHLTEQMGEQVVRIQAESYLKDLYESYGFQVISEPYLEFNIWHVDMLLEKGDEHEVVS
ncbi:ElaA protein [Amphibacillus marinus]|uniref:ElaA protein n=1 Tax=Amphibacillus marinus TaxID=872970 RepID=A0A1H8JSI5_9BACI|nr:GNAT family N-acetyltransferase [Amphibacillus marinus]SEN83690.1 ElaA protein [Amphibacillus marinus]